MADLPLLFLPEAKTVQPAPGHGGGKLPKLPVFNTQKSRLAPKFQRLKDAFDSYRAEVADTAVGLIPEQVIVIQVAGRLDEFIRAVRSVGMEWLGEVDGEFPAEEGFAHLSNKNKVTDKPVPSRLFLAMTDQQAMNELLSLWQRWSNGEIIGGPHTKWRDIFNQCKEIRRWNELDRLQEGGVLDYWKDEIELKRGTASTLNCEIELWYRSNPEHQVRAASALAELVQQEGGEIIGNQCLIDAVHFHAFKVKLSPESVDRALNGEFSALFKNNDIRVFRPSGQCVTETFEVLENPVIDEQERRLASDTKQPVVALLDGVPLVRHNLLDNRLQLDDPNDYFSEYQVSDFNHGTSMSSLICHGELDDPLQESLDRHIIVHPIMKPDGFNRVERIPETVFPEDITVTAIRSIKESALGKDVRIVNLSIGDPARPHVNEISAWARVLDWLSWEYNILFCISAGNCTNSIPIGFSEDDYKNLSHEEKVAASLRAIEEGALNRKILAPAESINSLTIGSLHADKAGVPQLGNRLDLLDNLSHVSPISRQGPGFLRAIKPDVVMSGGRQLYSDFSPSSDFVSPGQKSAAVGSQASPLNNTTYTRGTSNATALTTRGAARIYEVLESLQNEQNTDIPSEVITPLIKALIIHGAAWTNETESHKQILKSIHPDRLTKRHASRYWGFGAVNIEKVLECTENRATAIGGAMIEKDQTHEYRFPLPPSLSGTTEYRKLTISIAWISPINPQHRNFRRAKLFFDPPAKGKSPLQVSRSDVDWQQTKKGTVQHEVLQGNALTEFIDGAELLIPVTCKEDAGALEDSIPYGIAVTLEVAENIDLPIYQEIRDRIQMQVPIQV